MSLLEAKHISKTFNSPASCTVLNDCSLYVNAGERVAILGKSGEGKSTLLHILGTLLSPSKGELYYRGALIQPSKSHTFRNRHLGFVFQSYHLLEDYSALDNVLFPKKIRREKIDPKQGLKLLDQVGLSHRSNHLARQLSGGEKQRVAIARALANAPELLMADEPSGNLDGETSAHIHSLLLDASKQSGRSLLVVTHDTTLASQCDRVYTLTNGTLSA